MDMDKRKKAFDALISIGYSHKAAYAHLSGKRLPRYSAMAELDRKGVIPFSAWLDIRAYLNDTPTTPPASRAPGAENAQKETA